MNTHRLSKLNDADPFERWSFKAQFRERGDAGMGTSGTLPASHREIVRF